jgi:hypothetical protein
MGAFYSIRVTQSLSKLYFTQNKESLYMGAFYLSNYRTLF